MLDDPLVLHPENIARSEAHRPARWCDAKIGAFVCAGVNEARRHMVLVASIVTFKSGNPVSRALKNATVPCFGVTFGGGDGAAALTWWLT